MTLSDNVKSLIGLSVTLSGVGVLVYQSITLNNRLYNYSCLTSMAQAVKNVNSLSYGVQAEEEAKRAIIEANIDLHNRVNHAFQKATGEAARPMINADEFFSHYANMNQIDDAIRHNIDKLVDEIMVINAYEVTKSKIPHDVFKLPQHF